jgi:hypothetical protein
VIYEKLDQCDKAIADYRAALKLDLNCDDPKQGRRCLGAAL